MTHRLVFSCFVTCRLSMNTHPYQNSKLHDRSDKHSAMSRTDSATLSTLPPEILHQIFDDLNSKTVFLSVRNVCQQLRAAVSTYHRYKLDFTTISKRVFHHLLVLIHPQRVTALTLNDRGTTPGQIGVFRSLIDVNLFTRLRSLTLLKIEGRDLCRFLEHARRCSLTSLTLDSRWCNTREQQRIAEHLASIIGQRTFLRLQLLSKCLCMLVGRLEWPAQCKLQFLKLEFFTEEQVDEILLRAPDLQTLVLGTQVEFALNHGNDAEEISYTLHPRLTSLTVSSRGDSMDTIWSLLSSTPSLRHLRIISIGVNWLDGSRWEELIKTKLPELDKFEFYFRFGLDCNRRTMPARLNRLMAPFRSPFWTKEKRWPITFNLFPTNGSGEIYTSPICISTYTYFRDQAAMTFPMFDDKDRLSTEWEEVDQLRVYLSKGTDQAEKVSRIER